MFFLLLLLELISSGNAERRYFINSREAIEAIIEDIMILQFKEFELYWGAVFLLRSVHTFS